MSEGLTRERLALEMRRASGPFLVLAALVVLAVTSLAVLAHRLQFGVPGQERYELRVAVDDASGVVPQNHEVRISGVVVGKITKVELQRGHAVLTASMDARYAPIYRNARLRLRPRTPLEDMYLNVEDRGTARAGRVGLDEVLAAERTRTPVHIRDVLEVLNADARPGMEQTIDNLGRGLGDRGDQFRAALVELAPFLRNAKRLTREYAVRTERTKRLVRNFRLITEELARRDAQVAKLAQAGGQTFDELGRVDRPLGELIRRLPPTLEQLPPTFETVRDAVDGVDAAAVSLRPAARALPRGLRAVTTLTPDLATASTALRRPLRPLTSMTRDTRPVARQLSGALGRLTPQTPRLDRIAAALPPCELAIRKFFAHTMSLSKYYDAFGVRPRGQSVVSTKGTTAGRVPDLGLISDPSCAKGGPRK